MRLFLGQVRAWSAGIHVFATFAKKKTWIAGHSRSKNGVASLAYARP